MKTSSANFWRRNLGFFRLAIITNLEYRLNFFTDAVAQPLLSAVIEITIWFAIFRSTGEALFAGFPLEHYLSYAIWATFMGRITSNWMYEMRMIEEIENGNINSLLTRPISFFEYYLSQFLGYKIVTTVFSLLFPLAGCLLLGLPLNPWRLPAALALAVYYLILVHCLSFLVSCLALRLNKVSGITTAKNLTLWFLSGELLPLDLFPGAWKPFMTSQPFANAVYVPVGYLTGRLDHAALAGGFLTTTGGILLFGALGAVAWRNGLRVYSGTGA